MVTFLEGGDTAKVRGTALGTLMMADHLCGRDAAFGPWLTATLQAKRASSRIAPTPQELTAPSLAERFANLDPANKPYLRSAADMAALGVGRRPGRRP